MGSGFRGRVLPVRLRWRVDAPQALEAPQKYGRSFMRTGVLLTWLRGELYQVVGLEN